MVQGQVFLKTEGEGFLKGGEVLALFRICLNHGRLVDRVRAGGGCVRVGGTV